jgi:hypothetical protein
LYEVLKMAAVQVLEPVPSPNLGGETNPAQLDALHVEAFTAQAQSAHNFALE